MTDTGLPELPNRDYFWRVRYHKTYNFGIYDWHTRVDKNRLQVQLIHKYVTTGARTEKKWLRTVTITDETVRETALFTEDTLGTNPIAVRNAANRIMKLWAKTKERDSLVGDYPPKKLEVTE